MSVSISISAPATKATMPPSPSAPKLGRKGLGHHQHQAENDQRQPGVIHRQQLQRIEREQQADRPDDARRHIARTHEFEHQAVDADGHQNQGNAGVGDRRQQPGAPVGREFDGQGARGLEAPCLSEDGHGLAVELGQQAGDVRRDDFDDMLLQSFLGAQADGFAHGALGPVGVASAHLRQAAQVGGGVVDRLARHGRAVGCLVADADLDRRCRAEIGAGAMAATWLAYRM
jgi:hypothetical protein